MALYTHSLDNSLQHRISVEYKRQIKLRDSNLEKVNNGDYANISDGNHTFNELYKHRTVLFATLCSILSSNPNYITWKSKYYDNQDPIEDHFFLVGIIFPDKTEISYHCAPDTWDLFKSVPERVTATPWNGYTPDDVLDSLIKEFL